MSASQTVDLERLSEAPPILARIGRGLSGRLTGEHLDRLGGLVEQIPPGAADTPSTQARCWDWFDTAFVPGLLDPAGVSRVGRTFTDMRGQAVAIWDHTKRRQVTTWLDAWDAGANALWCIGASVIWQELAGQRNGATPGWDAAAHAVRILAADKTATEFGVIVSNLQASVVDLYEGLVRAAR